MICQPATENHNQCPIKCRRRQAHDTYQAPGQLAGVHAVDPDTAANPDELDGIPAPHGERVAHEHAAHAQRHDGGRAQAAHELGRVVRHDDLVVLGERLEARAEQARGEGAPEERVQGRDDNHAQHHPEQPRGLAPGHHRVEQGHCRRVIARHGHSEVVGRHLRDFLVISAGHLYSQWRDDLRGEELAAVGGWVILRGPWKAVRAGEGFAPSNERLCLLHERRGRVAEYVLLPRTCCPTPVGPRIALATFIPVP